MLHILRRNLDVTIVLFNNRIYGLTKGQYSPTSEFGKVTKSTPLGTTENPVDPIRFALAAGATFIARSIDRDTKHLETTLLAAAQHKGVSIVEVYQNCNIFNDGAFAAFAEKDVRDDRLVYLEHGKPMRFGKERQSGIRLDGFQPEVVEEAADDADLLTYDAHREDSALASIVATMTYPDFPVPVGIFRQIERPTYEDLVDEQVTSAREQRAPDLASLIAGPETWEVV